MGGWGCMGHYFGWVGWVEKYFEWVGVGGDGWGWIGVSGGEESSWWILFVIWMTNKRHLALFPVSTTVRWVKLCSSNNYCTTRGEWEVGALFDNSHNLFNGMENLCEIIKPLHLIFEVFKVYWWLEFNEVDYYLTVNSWLL